MDHYVWRNQHHEGEPQGRGYMVLFSINTTLWYHQHRPAPADTSTICDCDTISENEARGYLPKSYVDPIEVGAHRYVIAWGRVGTNRETQHRDGIALL